VVPIEVVLIIVIALFGLVGLVRGFLRELGVTLPLVVLLWAYATLGARLLGLMERGMAVVGYSLPTTTGDMIRCSFLLTTLIFVTFIAYQGETLAFGGTNPPGMQGWLLALLIGLVNGYLIAGTAWYFLAHYNYPFQTVGLVQLPLTPLGQTIASYALPLYVLRPLLPFLVFFLIILRIIR
jgi:uncharacterized membrane protein required for colicin V production